MNLGNNAAQKSGAKASNNNNLGGWDNDDPFINADSSDPFAGL